MRIMRIFLAGLILVAGLAAGCAPYHTIEGAKCPCTEGWVCCPDQTCARTIEDCSCETKAEVCDWLDNDCDRMIDEDCCLDLSGWYRIELNCPPRDRLTVEAAIVQQGCSLSIELDGNQCTGEAGVNQEVTLECLGLGPRDCQGVWDLRLGMLGAWLECQADCTVTLSPEDCHGAPDGTVCNDQNPCTVNEQCDSGVCRGTRVECDDGDPCTLDNCSEFTGCRFEPKVPCQACSADSDCDDQNPCTGDACVDGFCDNLPGEGSQTCDDGDPCTTDDRCSYEGDCQGNPRFCNDGNGCTAGSCDAATGECRFELDPDCRPCGGDHDCYDADFCTEDRCFSGRCAYFQEPNGRSCVDDLFCTVQESCLDGVCRGSLRSCDDSDNCTLDTCNETTDTCTHHLLGSCSDMGNLRFHSADPEVLGVAGSGYQEQSLVTFGVLTTDDRPLPNVRVEFSTNSSVGVAPVSVLSDQNGLASTTLSSVGFAHTFRVTARAQQDEIQISAESPPLRIVGVKPSVTHSRFSCERQNIGAFTTGFVGLACPAGLNDRNHNHIGVATEVLFFSEAGSIGALAVTSVQAEIGVAETRLTGNSPHPLDLLPSWEPFIDVHGVVHNPSDGLSSMIAVFVGEEEFTDENGNGQYDPGEDFADLPEPFVDANDSGYWDSQDDYEDFPEEPYIDTNNNGRHDEPNGVWDQDALVWVETKVVWTGNLAMGADCQADPRYSVLCPDSFYVEKGGVLYFDWEIKDANLNPLNESTVIDATVEGKGSLSGSSPDLPYNVPDLLYGDDFRGGIDGDFAVYGAPLDDTSGPQPGTITLHIQYKDDAVGGEIHYETITVHGTFE